MLNDDWNDVDTYVVFICLFWYKNLRKNKWLVFLNPAFASFAIFVPQKKSKYIKRFSHLNKLIRINIERDIFRLCNSIFVKYDRMPDTITIESILYNTVHLIYISTIKY